MPTINKVSHLLIDPPVGQHRVVHNQATNRYFRLGVREASFLEVLDGTLTTQHLREQNLQGFSPEQVDALLHWLGEQQLLERDAADAPAQPTPWYRRMWDWMSQPDRLRVHLVNPDRFLDRQRRFVDFCFSRIAIGGYLALFILSAIVLPVWPGNASATLAPVNPTSSHEWFALYVLFLLTNVLHEMAHAVACKHFGGRVTKIGLMFFYLYPVVYVDVSDSWRFREYGHRIVVSSAGLFLQCILSAVALTVWRATGLAVLLVYFWTNVILVLINLFPFVKLDGYWILANAVKEPNLRQKGLAALDALIRRLLRGKWRVPEKHGQASVGVLAFGVGHAIAVFMFWVLGFLGVLRFAMRLPIVFAWVPVAFVAVPLSCRFGKAGWGYFKSLGA